MTVSKYNASGNDFVIFHTFNKQNRSELAKKLCNRNSGVGADGLIVIIPHENLDFEWEFYNSDGSLADMCANGSRAAALYAYNNDLATSSLDFLTGAGVIKSTIKDSLVEVELTTPKKVQERFIDMDKEWHFFDTGVPHLVHITDNLDTFDTTLARQMRYKYNANVNFAKKIGNDLYVRTYERGVEAETLACGTGMAASFLALREVGLLKNKTKVYPTSKEELWLRYENNKILFKGLVSHIFDANLRD